MYVLHISAKDFYNNFVKNLLGETLMKIRNSLAILCSAAFCFAFALTGCNKRNNNSNVSWTVTFDSKGGSPVEAQEVKDGETVAKPANPTKENFTFVEWCEDNNCVTPFNFSMEIHSDWTLYAKWQSSGGGGGGGGGGDQPTTGDYYAQIGSQKLAMTADTERIAETQLANYVCTYASLTAGDTIHFLNNEEQTITNVGPDADYDGNHNNVSGTFDAGYTIHNDATNAKVSLRVWEDGYSFWIEGYSTGGGGGGGEQPGEPHGPAGSTLVSWYIVGQGSFSTNDWQISGGVQLYSNPASGTDKGCILSISFEVGDKFKVTDGTTWYGYEKVDPWNDPSNKGLHNFEGVDDGYGGQNFKCTTAGTYDMYVNKDGNFWIQSAA